MRNPAVASREIALDASFVPPPVRSAPADQQLSGSMQPSAVWLNATSPAYGPGKGHSARLQQTVRRASLPVSSSTTEYDD